MIQQYIGSKLIQAQAMNRQTYNDYRNWQLPDDENGSDEGYLVEYLDGGKPNHPEHVGYISWSPKEQFDKAYMLVGKIDHLPPFHQRLIAEKTQLDDKIIKLSAFLGTTAFYALSAQAAELLHTQLHWMERYSDTLGQRIAQL